MHPYVTDAEERTQIPALLGVVSVALAWGLGQVFQSLQVTPPWWLDTPAVLGFIAILITLFDRYVWRWPLLQKLGLVNTPDLQGRWEGSLVSSYEGATEQRAWLRITQTWRHILMEFETEYSRSKSNIAVITVKATPTVEVTYQYLSEPKPGALTTMQTHRGTAQLRLEKAGVELVIVGEYYTGRGRQNFGSLHFRRSGPAG